MGTYKFTDKTRFVLPTGYEYLKEKNEDGEDIFRIVYGPSYNDDGDKVYDFSVNVSSGEYILEDGADSISLQEACQNMAKDKKGTKYFIVPGDPECMFISMPIPFSFFGVLVKSFAFALGFLEDKDKLIILTAATVQDDEDPKQNDKLYEHMMKVAKSVQVNGRKLPLEQLTAKKVQNALKLSFSDEDSIMDVSPTLKFEISDGEGTTTYEYTKDGLQEVATDKLKQVDPDEKLYPHYGSLKSNVFAMFGANVNTTGTEYQFYSFDSYLNRMSDDEEARPKRELLEKCLRNNPTGYTLGDKARDMIGIFHVKESIFNMSHDREAELDEGYIRRAYMVNALRSFAWTLTDYCKTNKVTLSKIDKAIPIKVAEFVESRDWLNYDGKTHCKGLCGNSDLHVFYIPDAISKTESKLFLPSKAELDDVKKTKEKFPNYNPILSEVGSLDKLRKDLEYIYPAIKILYDDIVKSRDINETLEGADSDIVYAWIAYAIAAEKPFFTEDGPVNYFLSQPTTDKEFNAKYGSKVKKAKEKSNAAPDTSEPETVIVDNSWAIDVPAGFKYCTDKKKIGSHRNLIIIEDKEGNDFEDSFSASISFTSAENDAKDVGGPSMASMMAGFMMDNNRKKVLRSDDKLYVVYDFESSDYYDGEKTDIFKMYVGCGRTVSLIQVFFNGSKLSRKEQTKFVESVAKTIRLKSEVKKKTNKSQKASSATASYSGSFPIESVPDNRKKLINGSEKEEYAVRFVPTSAYLKDGEVFNATFIHYCRKYNPDFIKNVDVISSAAERYIGLFEEDEQTDIRYGYLKTTLPIHALRSFVWTAVETQPANKRKSFPEDLTEEVLAEMAAFIRDKDFANYATMKKTVVRYGALLLSSEEVRREYSLFNPLIRSLNNLNDWKLIDRDYYDIITRAGSADLSQLAILISELIRPMDMIYSIVVSDSYDDYTKEAAKEILKGWCLFAFAGKQPFFSMHTKDLPVESVKGETVNSINYEPEFETIDEGRYTLFKGYVVECNDKRRNAVIPEGVIDFAPVSYNKGYLQYFDSSDTVTYPESYRGDILMTEGVKEIIVNSNCDVLRFERAFLSRSEDFKLETVIINGKIKELDGFYGLDSLQNLTKLVLPDSLEKIGGNGIMYNKNLKDITLPEGLKEIGPEALSFCGIQTITIPSSVEIIGEGAFNNYRFNEKGITIRAYRGSYGLEWAKKLQREKGNAVKIVELEPIWMEKAREFSSKISAEYASSIQSDDIKGKITDIIDTTLKNDENYSKGRKHIISNIYSDEMDLVKKTVQECETIDELKAKLPSLLAEDIPKVKREKEIKKTKNLISEKKQQISRLEKEIADKEERIKNYEKEIDENQQMISSKEASLGYDLGNKKFQLTTNLNGQKAVIFKLEEKVKEIEILIENTSKELENAGFFKFSLKKELNAKIDSLNSEIDKIRENLESESTKLDEITKDYNELVEKPSAELESLKSKVSNLIFTKRQISASIDSSKKSIEDYKREILRLEEKLNEM